MKWLRKKYLAMRWLWFWGECERLHVYPLARERLTRAEMVLDDLYWLTQESGYLRDGRYPGGRHAERKIRVMVDELDALFGFMHRDDEGSFDFPPDVSLLTKERAPTTFH